MNPLPLKPLPAARLDEDSASWRMEREGFVDESVVAKLVAMPRNVRIQASQDDLALAADDLDFAGWQIASMPAPTTVPDTSPSAFCGTEEMPSMRAIIARRATPPQVAESSIVNRHLSRNRWWLAGLAGAFSTLVFSILLFVLSFRTAPEPRPSVGSTLPVTASEVAKKGSKEIPAAPLAASSQDSLR